MKTPLVNVPWYKAPVYSRKEFSPRLLMAWVVLGFMLWLIRRWITTPSQVLNGILIQPPSVAEVVGILAALLGGLLSLGTLQKIRLDGPPPASEVDNSTTIQADSAPVSANSVTVNPS
jgi:hypothetical protein